MTPAVSTIQLTVAKAGNSEDENEDFAAVLAEDDWVFAAIADGATDAAFSREWARALVTERLRDPSATFVTAVSAARSAWRQSIPSLESLPWYGQARLAEGSAATFLSVAARRSARGWMWVAESVGDCELLTFSGSRSPQLRRAIPLRDAADFGSRPSLVRTHGSVEPTVFVGLVQAPAELWLMTDAAAEACLRAHRHGHSPWAAWRTDMASEATFRQLVEDWRDGARMKNDDVTVVRAQLW
jgi:hypothetical protein